MIETIEIKWDLLGAKLAKLSDKEQSEFFKGFSFELSRFESNYKAQLQMSFVSDKLNKKEKVILKDNLSILWFEDNET